MTCGVGSGDVIIVGNKYTDDGYPLWMVPTIVHSNGKPTPPDLYWYANLDTRQTERLCLSEAVSRKRNGERLEIIGEKDVTKTTIFD